MEIEKAQTNIRNTTDLRAIACNTHRIQLQDIGWFISTTTAVVQEPRQWDTFGLEKATPNCNLQPLIATSTTAARVTQTCYIIRYHDMVISVGYRYRNRIRSDTDEQKNY